MKLFSLSVAIIVLSLSACDQQSVPPQGGQDAPDKVAPAPGAVEVPSVSIFKKYEIPSNIIAGGHCFLDAINGLPKENAVAKVGQDISFGGWISDANNQVPPDALMLIDNADGAYVLPMVAGAERLDVAAALANEALKNSGYNVVGKLEGVVPGKYKVGIVLEGAAPVRCELNADITISG